MGDTNAGGRAGAGRTLRALMVCLLAGILLCLAFSPLAQADDPTNSITIKPTPDPIWTVTPSLTAAKAGDSIQVTVSDTAYTSWSTGLVVTGQSGTSYPFTTITAATGNANGVNGAGVYSFVMPSEPVSVGFTWDATPLNVYVKLGSGAKTLVHTYTRAEMEALATANTTPVYFALWDRSMATFMGKAVRYVTIPQLVASAHTYNSAVRFDGPDCVMTGLSLDGWTTNMPWSYLLGTTRKYYAALGDPYLDPANQTGIDREVPPVLAITGWGGRQVHVDNQPYDTLNTYRFWYGLSADQYLDGTPPTMAERDARCTANNMAKFVTELTFEVPETYTVIADSSITGGTLAVSPTSGIAGTTITVTATPNPGWQLVSGSLRYTTDGGSTYTAITATGGVYSFALPGANTLVTALFGDLSVPVTGVSLSKTTDAIILGKTDQLTATITPATAGNQNVTWTSSNTSVATVSSTGLVMAKAVGTTTITITTEDGGLAASCAVTVQAGGLDHFTIAVLPDTQFYSESYPGIFAQQAQWIADHKASENIVFVAQTGDIIDDCDSATEWQNARADMNIIRDAGIPYAVAPGNHDLGFDAVDTTQFDTYFPYADFTGYSWYGGHFPATSNTSSYQLFTAMGQKFVVLDLVCAPTLLDAATDWANDVLDQYSDRKAIIITHGYVQATGDLAGGDWISGPAIRNNIVRYHQNVIAVICGHIAGEYHGTDTGDNGNTVYNLLTDYTDQPNGGNGWLRLYEFYPLENKISAVTYSPYLDAYQTDADSRFDLALEQDSHAVTFVSDGSAYTSVVAASGSQVSAPADPVKTGYTFGGWYTDEALTIAASFPYTVTADTSIYAKWTCDFAYTTSGTTATITGYTGPGGAVVIPSAFTDGGTTYTVAAIADVEDAEQGAFYNRTDITSVTLPDTLTSIGAYAFCYCTGLTSIVIPDSVVSVGDFAFMSCQGITSVKLSSNLTSIGGWAFCGCDNSALTAITFPDTLTSIGTFAFNYAPFTSITIPAGVTSIGSWAFNGTYLTSTYFLGNPPAMGTQSLGNTSAQFTLYYNVTQAASWAGFADYPSAPFCVLALDANYAGGAATTVYTPLDSGYHLAYPVHVPSRSGYTFAGWYKDAACTDDWDFATDTVSGDQTLYANWTTGTAAGSLTIASVVAGPTYNGTASITLGSTVGAGNSFVYKVTDRAVSGVTTSTTIADGLPCSSGVNTVFVKAGQYVTIYEVTAASTVVNYVCRQIAPSEVRPGVYADGFNYLLSGGTATVNGYVGPGGAVVIPSSITVEGATYPVTALYTASSAATGAFYNQTSITSVTIPSSVTDLGAYAFYFCNNLHSVVLPDEMAGISAYAFCHCGGLTSITIPSSVTSIGDSAFQYCSSLASVTIPSSVTSLGAYAFGACTHLTSVNIPDSVTSLGEGAFAGSGLASITIPSSVTGISAYAFYKCASLASVTLPGTLVSLGRFSFGECTGLTQITLPAGLTSIGSAAFVRCSGLTSVTLPSSVTNVDSYAFHTCANLRSAYFLGGRPTFGSDVFAYAPSGFTLYYHVSQASSWSGFTAYTAKPFCTLTLDLQDGSTPASSYVAIDASGHLSAPASPTRQGYVFGGWYEDAAGSTAFNFSTESVTGDLTLYAMWNAAPTTVTVPLSSGWNLVAGGAGTSFPATLFGWDGTTFVSTASCADWQGYWCKLGSAQTVSMTLASGPRTVTLATGWNLIGNPMGSTAALALPSGRVAFVFDTTGHTYVSTISLAPGQGAWVKGNAGETVTLTAE